MDSLGSGVDLESSKKYYTILGVIIILDTIADYGAMFGTTITHGVAFPIVEAIMGPLVALTFLLSFIGALKGKAHLMNLYMNKGYLMAAVVAIVADIILYLTKKDSLYCPAPDAVTGEVGECATLQFYMWGIMVVVAPIWYMVINKMEPYCLKELAEAVAEAAMDKYTAA